MEALFLNRRRSSNELFGTGLSDLIMFYYAIQVRTRSEEKFIRLFKKENPDNPFQIYFPKRQLNIRRAGKTRLSTYSIFPGYIFVESNNEDIIDYQYSFRKTEGFYRFLKSNKEITPLSDQDMELVLHFLKTVGSVAGVSKVCFNDNSRIVVLEGPLAGLEGRIIKVDKRKGRAKIKLDLYDESFSIDLAFEVIGSLESAKKAS